MTHIFPHTFLGLSILLGAGLAASGLAADRVKTANGVVEGTGEPRTPVRAFKGIPFAQAPTGDLRWKPPQPLERWKGVRRAVQFGPRCMQRPVFADMNFRSNGVSEDCLYLNIWTPAKSAKEKLPVLVYFYGGGFVAGDGSEPRYDGESMARKGIVALTVNYRLGALGFLAHPELTKESPQHASGNYGLLDLCAALQWVQKNIAAFGGDPKKVTIAGESAGSLAVSAQMASPLSKGLFAGAIGESGSVLGTLPAVPLGEAEKTGVAFQSAAGATSLAALRAMPADDILKAEAKPGMGRFAITVDGYFFTEPPLDAYRAGKQARVPLLVGWNSEEMTWRAMLRDQEPTPENYANAVRKLYGDRADGVLKAYPASTQEETIRAATDLAGDRFIGFSTWKWSDLCGKTGGKPVYRYLFARPRPGAAGGAVHSAEIEYAMGNLSTNKVYAWTDDDHAVSKVMQEYFANFVKTGNPNGAGLPEWPAANSGEAVQVMRIDAKSAAAPEQHRERYMLLDEMQGRP